MPYKIWRDLNDEQRKVWRDGFAGAQEGWFLAREFWVQADGVVKFNRALVRQAGLADLIAGLSHADQETVISIVRGDRAQSKGDLQSFKTCDFHFAPEKP